MVIVRERKSTYDGKIIPGEFQISEKFHFTIGTDGLL